MTELALELDEKLAQLAPAKARALERRVREAIALAEADLSSNAEVPEGGRLDWLEMQVQPFPLPTADYEQLAETLDGASISLKLENNARDNPRRWA